MTLGGRFLRTLTGPLRDLMLGFRRREMIPPANALRLPHQTKLGDLYKAIYSTPLYDAHSGKRIKDLSTTLIALFEAVDEPNTRVYPPGIRWASAKDQQRMTWLVTGLSVDDDRRLWELAIRGELRPWHFFETP